MSLRLDSSLDEEIYGMGLQYSEWNLKGKNVPLVSVEAGVGRGLEPITSFLNGVDGSGGTTTTSYAPAAQFITNKRRALIVDPLFVGEADFSSSSAMEILYWHADSLSGHILYGEDELQLA